jgi:hypothetical protein
MTWEGRVRKRKSYALWQELALFLSKRPGVSRTLWRLFFLLDEKSAFGSQIAMAYAYESLQLYCRDNNLDRRDCYGP